MDEKVHNQWLARLAIPGTEYSSNVCKSHTIINILHMITTHVARNTYMAVAWVEGSNSVTSVKPQASVVQGIRK